MTSISFSHSKILRLLVVISALLAPYQACAENIMDIYHLALAHSPSLTFSKASVRIAKAKVDQSEAKLWPQITATASIRKHSGSNNYVEPSHSIILTQPLFDYSKIKSIDLAKQQVMEAKIEEEKNRSDLIYQVVESYFNVLMALEELSTIRAKKTSIEEGLKQAQVRHHEGVITKADLIAIQASFDLVKAQENESQRNLSTAWEEIRALTGKNIKNIDKINSNCNIATNLGDIHQWEKLTIEHNKDILAAKHSLIEASKEILVEKGKILPTLSLEAGHTYSDNSGLRSWWKIRDNYIGANITLNLFNGGGDQSRIKEALEEYEQAKAKYNETVISEIKESHNQYYKIISEIASLKAWKKSVISAQTYLKVVKIGYDNGKYTELDVLQAIEDLYEAKKELVETQYNLLIDMINLKRIAGVLEESDIINYKKECFQFPKY